MADNKLELVVTVKVDKANRTLSNGNERLMRIWGSVNFDAAWTHRKAPSKG
jgi:hypothetical protein